MCSYSLTFYGGIIFQCGLFAPSWPTEKHLSCFLLLAITTTSFSKVVLLVYFLLWAENSKPCLTRGKAQRAGLEPPTCSPAFPNGLPGFIHLLSEPNYPHLPLHPNWVCMSTWESSSRLPLWLPVSLRGCLPYSLPKLAFCLISVLPKCSAGSERPTSTPAQSSGAEIDRSPAKWLALFGVVFSSLGSGAPGNTKLPQGFMCAKY